MAGEGIRHEKSDSGFLMGDKTTDTLPGQQSTIHLSALAAALGVITVLLFWQTQHFDFSSYDDHLYVHGVDEVMRGLTWDGVKWAFSYPLVNCPHPLAYISLMLDSTLYGHSPAGYLLTNVLLHASSSVMLFVLLARVGGALLPAFAVAAVFAWHPTRAESVAWISERKDVLSTFFAILTIAGYCWWRIRKVKYAYCWAVLLPFSLAILSKPSVVALPCVLMLLDLWPLHRLVKGIPSTIGVWGYWKKILTRLPALLPDKIPLFLIGMIYGALTYQLTNAYDVSADWQRLPLGDRVVYAIEAYRFYLEKFFVPINLSPLHIHPAVLPPPERTLTSLILLGLISLLALLRTKERPAWIVGWLWFLGVLLPVSGILQNGLQLTANRYSYFPYVGLSVLLFHGFAPDMARRFKGVSVRGLQAATALWLGWILALAWVDAIPVWKTRIALWEAAVSVDPHNEHALMALGGAWHQEGKKGTALVYVREAHRLCTLGRESDTAWKWRVSQTQLEAAKNLSLLLASTGRHQELFQLCHTYPQLDLRNHSRLSAATYHAQQGNLKMAEMIVRNSGGASSKLQSLLHSSLLRELGRSEEAVAGLQKLKSQFPEDPLILSNLAVSLAFQPADYRAACGEALALAEKAMEIAGRSGSDRDRVSAMLAHAYVLARLGKPEEAIAFLERGADLPQSLHQAVLEWVRVLKQKEGAPPLPDYFRIGPAASGEGDHPSSN